MNRVQYFILLVVASLSFLGVFAYLTATYEDFYYWFLVTLSGAAVLVLFFGLLWDLATKMARRRR